MEKERKKSQIVHQSQNVGRGRTLKGVKCWQEERTPKRGKPHVGREVMLFGASRHGLKGEGT